MPYADLDLRREYGRDLKRRDPEAYAKRLAQTKAWRARQEPERNRCRHLMSKYGITVAQRDAMLSAQGGCCKLSFCRRAIAFNGTAAMLGAHIDHCHKTGKIRGILCGRCNVTIGYFKDDPDRLLLAAEYLEAQGNV